MSKPLYESEPLEGSKPQAVSELECLIVFWRDRLAEHRLLMSPSTVYLVEQTIKSLEKLLELYDCDDCQERKLALEKLKQKTAENSKC